MVPEKNPPRKNSPREKCSRKIGRRRIGPRKMFTEKNGSRKNGPREKWSPENWSPENWSPENWSPENWSPENWSPENWSPEKWFPENWSPEKWFPEKCPSKIVLRQKNVKKFKRLFYFYQLIPLHTQKNVWRLRHDPTYVPNSKTLKESRKICCRVLGFHRLIISQHSTPTPRCSTPTPRFFVSEFPGDQFSGHHFSGIQENTLESIPFNYENKIK